MTDNFLVLNSGSQSEKVAVFQVETVDKESKSYREIESLKEIYRGNTAIAALSEREKAISDLIDKSPIDAKDVTMVGHRIVHGGTRFQESIIADAAVLDKLSDLNDLAPLHNPPAIAGIEASVKLFPQAKQVLVFDTAFHKDLDPAHYLYPLPEEWKKFDIRKYGFHGISHQYCCATVAKMLEKEPRQINMISCHLGGGSSVCAIEKGISIDISMGFSPLDGVMMGTRSGALDPAIIFHLLEQKVSTKEIEEGLNKKAGILGVSELSSDMKDIHKAIAAGNPKAKLAFEMFALSIAKSIAAMSTNFTQLDAVAFTGGIGFHDAITRAAILPSGNLLKLELSTAAGDTNAEAKTRLISNKQSACKIFAVEADEELVIAQECQRLSLSSLERSGRL